ncbi:tetratricopeptide (TPR) repeat protein [Pelomonas saccharophila]|uniref:Tetratricopeptide (TPR) repeat protein n=1 Tax=Roseateles saccharophilus TaxID=304 RepID=A0ABU1YW34_ROSSA|nr:hypothetical protein [Roseateles saccharophilus]MDR7272421.1 tetratricopeptide (TPR) repeat protein [Roseateles saccharophilus]
MTMRLRLRVTTLLLLPAMFGATASAAAADWLRAESKHFRMLSSTSAAVATQKLRDLEQVHEAMLAALGVKETLVRPPFPIVLSDDPGIIGQAVPHLAGRDFAGVFLAGADGSEAFAVNYPWHQKFSGSVLFHEYAHRVQAQYARGAYPAWFVEGFAEFFGSTRLSNDGVEVGAANNGAAILLDRSWLSPEQILKPGFHATGDKAVDDRYFNLFYAQSWLLTHYVLKDRGRTQRFDDYFRRVAAGEDALAVFEPATGIALNRLNGELRRYMENLYASLYPASAPAEVRITPMTREQGDSEFDALVIAGRPEAAYGKAVLQRLRERVTKAGGGRAPDTMRWALAYAEVRYGDPDRALEILAPWAPLDGAPFEANRLLGWAWLAVAESASGAERDQATDQARAFLMAAYKQRRNDAPTMYQLARVLYHKGPSDSLSKLADGANVLEPQVPDYAYLAVTVHLESGNRDKALRGLQSLASNPHGGEGTERARAALQALQSNQDAPTVLALLNGTKKPTTP